jgi:hypothetical protein
MEVLGALVCLRTAEIHRLNELETLFDYRPGELASVMGELLALVRIPDLRHLPVEIYHASLPDFLFDPTRSQSFYVDPAAIYLNLAQRCVPHLPSTELNEFRDEAPKRFVKIFQECISATPFTEDLSHFFLDFSFWDRLLAQFSPFLDSMETGTVKLRKALTNMSRMVMPALLICRNIFRLPGPRRHLDVSISHNQVLIFA